MHPNPLHPTPRILHPSHPFLGDLKIACNLYQTRVLDLEGEKWDIERSCKIKLLEVNRKRERDRERKERSERERT
jgi:hypothetical protein